MSEGIVRIAWLHQRSISDSRISCAPHNTNSFSRYQITFSIQLVRHRNGRTSHCVQFVRILHAVQFQAIVMPLRLEACLDSFDFLAIADTCTNAANQLYLIFANSTTRDVFLKESLIYVARDRLIGILMVVTLKSRKLGAGLTDRLTSSDEQIMEKSGQFNHQHVYRSAIRVAFGNPEG